MSTPPSRPAREPFREVARGRVRYLAILAGYLAVGALVILLTDGDPRVFWPAAVVGAVAAGLGMRAVWRCPHCDSPLGRHLFPARCGRCGRSLRRPASPG